MTTPENGPQPVVVAGADLASALAGGSRYANSVAGSIAIQPNSTGTASLRCDLPAGAAPVVAADGSQLVADDNGNLYPASMAGLGVIGYPAYTTSTTAAANTTPSTAAGSGASTASSTSAAIVANANRGAWNAGVYLCTPENGPEPIVVAGSDLAAALAGGSRYANSVAGSTAIQPNSTGTASLRCDLPAQSTPVRGADGQQLVADGNGDLYPASTAGLGEIGYPAYTSP